MTFYRTTMKIYKTAPSAVLLETRVVVDGDPGELGYLLAPQPRDPTQATGRGILRPDGRASCAQESRQLLSVHAPILPRTLPGRASPRERLGLPRLAARADAWNMSTEREPTEPRWNESAIRDTVLAWTETGSGPIAIWAYPLCSSSLTPEAVSSFNWEPVAAGGHRLIRYDARGHGRSGGQPNPADFSFENLARDLLALIDVLSPEAPVAGIGLSLGTATLLHAAVLAPDRFEKLVLTAPPTAWETRAPQSKLYASLAELVEERGGAAVESLLRDAPVPVPHQGAPGLPLPVEVDERLLPSLLRGAGDSDLP
jgi:3-oxoadipate enol-lactonase